MAITKSAKKAHKRSLVLRARNFDFKWEMKKAIKNLRKGVEDKLSGDDLKGLLALAYSAIDKAGRRNIVHRKNADRKKRRLNTLVKSVA